MRTTIDIDDDVLRAAKELARRQRTSAGRVISELARRGLNVGSAKGTEVREPEALYGLRPFPSRGGIVTNDIIDRLREDDAY
jgi:hypothetical protein